MVYVDDMHLSEMGRYGRMRMCHMLADTDEELHAMAARIGVARRWWQSPEKTSGSHYDIAMSKRALALSLGALPITMKQASAMNVRRRVTGQLGDPADAVAWLKHHRITERARRKLPPGDQAELARFEEFLRDSATMHRGELYQKHRDLLALTDEELARASAPSE